MGQKAFLKAGKNSLAKREPNERIPDVHLLFVQGTTDKIVRILKMHSVPVTLHHLYVPQIGEGSYRP